MGGVSQSSQEGIQQDSKANWSRRGRRGLNKAKIKTEDTLMARSEDLVLVVSSEQPGRQAQVGRCSERQDSYLAFCVIV